METEQLTPKERAAWAQLEAKVGKTVLHHGRRAGRPYNPFEELEPLGSWNGEPIYANDDLLVMRQTEGPAKYGWLDGAYVHRTCLTDLELARFEEQNQLPE